MTLRRPFLPLLALPALLIACGDDGTAPPEEVAEVVVTPSDATLTQVDETQQFTAQALTEDGDPVPDATVTWTSTNMTVATVDAATGLATAVGDGTTRIVAEVDGVEGDADLTVEIVGLQVSSPVLTNGRLTLPYQGSVEAKGGTGGYTFEVVQGTLPAGLGLEPGGDIVGTPTQVGTGQFTVRVTDSSGDAVSRQVSLTVCEAPEAFTVGESVALASPPRGACGVFLPAGPDHRYRAALIRTNTNQNAGDVETLTLTLEANAGGAGAAPQAVRAAPASPQEPRLRLSAPALGRSQELMGATRARHEELRRQEAEMIRRIGAAGVLPDLRDAPGRLRIAGAAQQLPDKLRIDPTTPTTCTPAGAEVTALKIAENDLLGIYQDSTQNAFTGTRVSVDEAQALLNFYADHGKPVIDTYFGGVPDIDDNGKVVIFISPVVEENGDDGAAAAFVWSGDFFSTEQCPASNEMEIVFFNRSIVADLDNPDQPAQGLETLVHEMKHVSSLYQRVLRTQAMNSGQYHPVWWEEGVAEIAGEVAVRAGWAADGGPAVTDRLDEDDWRDAFSSGESITDAQYGVLLRLFRAQGYLASQPNGLVVAPEGAREDHSIYGSGWVFARWLGDGFADAASAPLAEGDFWAGMNDQDWPSGVPGIEQATGMGWTEVLDRYVLALMLHATPAAPPEQAFTTYDFVSAIELWCFAADTDDPPCDDVSGPAGVFPWPVTTSAQGVPARSFASAEYAGPAGPGGVRIFEFVSDGTGAGTELHAEAPASTRMVVVRIN